MRLRRGFIFVYLTFFLSGLDAWNQIYYSSVSGIGGLNHFDGIH